MYVNGFLENASDFFIIRADEEFQTLVVVAVDKVLFQSAAQGHVNGGSVALSRFPDARVTDCTVTIGIEMQTKVPATHSTLWLVVTSAAEAVVVVRSTAFRYKTTSFAF